MTSIFIMLYNTIVEPDIVPGRQKESALLKHEVAFVLGQLEHTGAVDALCDAVSRKHEHSMVRF